MSSALVIAATTYREGVRKKTLIAFLLFGMLTLACSVFLTVFSPGEEVKIIKDVCLTGISFFGMLIAVFVSGAMLPTEMENRVFYTIISKPMRRSTYLSGKFLGAQFLILLNLLLMTILFLVILWSQQRRFAAGGPEAAMYTPAGFGLTVVIVLKAMVLVYAELAILSAWTMAASTVATSATLPVIFGVFIYLVGHLVEQLKNFATIAGDNVVVVMLARILQMIVPNLSVFRLRDNLIHNDPYIPQGMDNYLLYGLLYVVAGLAVSYFLFRRKEV